jgi:hypothetical protein
VVLGPPTAASGHQRQIRDVRDVSGLPPIATELMRRCKACCVFKANMYCASLNAISKPSEIAAFNESPNLADEVADRSGYFPSDLARSAADPRASEMGP